MFPITITLHNNDQLSAVLAALGTQTTPVDKPAKGNKTAQATVATNGASSTPETPSPADAAAQKPVEDKAAATAPSTASDAAGFEAAAQATGGNPAAPVVQPPSYDDVKAAVLGLVKSKGRDAAVGVLKSFGLESAQGAKPEQYAEILAAVKKAGE